MRRVGIVPAEEAESRNGVADALPIGHAARQPQHPPHVACRIPSMTTDAPFRGQDAIAALPRAQGVHAHAGLARESSDRNGVVRATLTHLVPP